MSENSVFTARVRVFSGNICDVLGVLKTALHTGQWPACACALATALQTTAHGICLASTNACSAAGMGSLLNVSLVLDSGSVFASNIRGRGVHFRIESKWL